MPDNPEPAIKLPPVEQIGIVVADVDQAVEHFNTLFGWGPFKIREAQMDRFIYRGRPGSGRLKVAVAYSGHLQIELIQVLEGETLHSDFMSKNGEGLQHLGFPVNDLDAMLANLAKEGIHAIFYRRFGGGTVAYLDTTDVGGTTFELIELDRR